VHGKATSKHVGQPHGVQVDLAV